MCMYLLKVERRSSDKLGSFQRAVSSKELLLILFIGSSFVVVVLWFNVPINSYVHVETVC